MTSAHRNLLDRAAGWMDRCTIPAAAELAEAGAVLIRHVAAPDLGDQVPVYVMPSSLFADSIAAAGEMFGCTFPRLAWVLRPHLGDKWAGPGPAMIVNDGALLASYGAGFATKFLGTVLHEAAHALARLGQILAVEPLTEADAEVYGALMGQVAEQGSAELSSDDHAERRAAWELHYEQHNPATFGRLMLHLQYRARRLGLYVPLSRLVGPCDPPLLPWSGLLGDEPARLMGASVPEILATPLPTRYAIEVEKDRAAFIEEALAG